MIVHNVCGHNVMFDHGILCELRYNQNLDSISKSQPCLLSSLSPPLFVNCAHVPLRENCPNRDLMWHGFYGLCRFAVPW